MQALDIANTNETPGVVLDKSIAKFQVSGRSLSDNPAVFYKPIIDWLKVYTQAPNAITEFEFKFEYLNTESSKSVLDILTTLEGINGVSVIWYFNEEDEDMEEIGEELAELVQIPFQFKFY